MFLIKAGDLEIHDSKPLELKGKTQDFESAKRKANKLAKTFHQVEIIDLESNECIHFQTGDEK